MKFSTKAIHVGQEAEPVTGATVLPIFQTSTYTQEEIGKHKGYEYSRTGNPTRKALEECLASLEEAEYGLAFASGLAATAAVLSILRPGDHVLAAADLYGGTYRLFEKVYRPLGIDFSYVEDGKPASFERALKPETRLIWLESPTNPLLQIVDIAGIAELTRGRDCVLAVDNTFATPYFQRPLDLGAHLAVHSTTKYVGGHSDIIGGAVLTSDRKLFEAVKFYQNAAGAVPGPFDAWLTLRGLKTLAVRMDRHEENAKQVAEYLVGHSDVKKVVYPGLTSHPQHELASKQMSGYGGIVTFEVDGGREQANKVVKSFKVFSFAESLGGVESLACYPCVMTHGSIPKEERDARGITEGLIRLSVGIEDIEDLIADLNQALSQAFYKP